MPAKIIEAMKWFNNCVFSERERSRPLYAVARPSVCLSSVTLVHPTQVVAIFGNFWATICKTVRPLLSDRCLSVLSVTLVYCGQTV